MSRPNEDNVLRGLTGEAGPAGPQGEPGQPGEKGEKGEPGEKGARGGEGSPGETGPLGPMGEKGEQGDEGDQGDTGLGSRGQRGLRGHTGAEGRIQQGRAGARGEAGAQGIEGEAGAQGIEGRRGRPGRTLGYWQTLSLFGFIVFAFTVSTYRTQVNSTAIKRAAYTACMATNADLVRANDSQNILIDIEKAETTVPPEIRDRRIAAYEQGKRQLLDCSQPRPTYIPHVLP